MITALLPSLMAITGTDSSPWACAPSLRVVVRGTGDVGSAVAHRLFLAGHAAVVHEPTRPATTRRGMAFADAVFDGDAVTVGLGPGVVAGTTTDLVVETSWEALGRVVTSGSALPLAGEPRAIGGARRECYVYAPAGGVFRTTFRIGDPVRAGAVIAQIESTALAAPLAGVLRGLTRDGVWVSVGTKVIEIDPRSEHPIIRGIGERPARIAEGALAAIDAWARGRR